MAVKMARIKFKNDEDFKQYLKQHFVASDAAAIYAAIQNQEFSRDWKIGDSVNTETLVHDTPVSEDIAELENSSLYDNTYVETPDVSTGSFFVRGENDDEYKVVVSAFNSRVIGDLLYNITVENPNSITAHGTYVNEKLHKYREDLLHTILSYKTTLSVNGEDIELKLDEVLDENLKWDGNYFAGIIDQALQHFDSIVQATKIHSDAAMDALYKSEAYHAYVTLRNFDKLLNKLGIVKISDECKNSNRITPNRYQYVGQVITYDQTYGKETADINEYTSEIIITLLNGYLESVHEGVPTGTKITFDGFKKACSDVSDWAWNYNISVAVDGDPTFNPHYEIRKGMNADWRKIFEAYRKYQFGNNKKDQSAYRIGLCDIVEGIEKQVFGDKLPKDIRELFIGQIQDTVRSTYLEYKEMFRNGDSSIFGVKATDKLLDRAALILKRRVASKIRFFKKNGGYDALVKALSSIGTLTRNAENGSYTLSLNSGESINFAWNSSGDPNFVLDGFVDDNDFDEKFIPVIETVLDTFIPSDYKDALGILYTSTGNGTLVDNFGQAVALVIYASDNSNFANLKFDQDTNTVKLYSRNNYNLDSVFTGASKFLQITYGYDKYASVHNVEGNIIPPYQLGSMFYRTKEIISDIKATSGHSLSENTFVENPSAIMDTSIREGVKVGNQTKRVDQLTPAEVLQLMIVQDYYVSGNATQTGNARQNVKIQPMTFADKTRQMVDSIDLQNVHLKGSGKRYYDIDKHLRETFLYNGNQKNTNLLSFEKEIADEIKYRRKEYYRNVIYKKLNAFSKALGLESEIKHLDSFSSYETLKDAWDKINRKLSLETKGSISKKFRDNNLTFRDEVDVVETSKGGLVLNPILKHNMDMYISENSDLLNNYIERQKLLYIRGLIDSGFVLSAYRDGNLRHIVDSWKTSAPNWVNSYAKSLQLYKLRDASGNDVTSKYDIDTVDLKANNLVLELNPILNGAFYSHMYLGQQLKALHFGESWEYKGVGVYDENDYNPELDESLRFIVQTKRAVIGGGTVKRYKTGLKYGITDRLRMAAVKDLEAPVNDLNAKEQDEKVADGSVYVSPEEALMEIESLQAQNASKNFSKNLFGEIDEDGCLNEIKTASFTMSNINRRQNPASRQINMERMFKLTHHDQIAEEKLRKIDISQYYSPNGETIITDGKRQITHSDYVFFKNNEDGKYYKILSVKTGRNIGEVIRTVAECNRYGENVQAPEEQTISFKSFYDLDQIFGGAWCMKRDGKSGRLIYNDANNKISYNVMCHQDLKNSIIHYVVNASAFKVGMKNLNHATVFSKKDTTEKLWEFTFNPKYSGVQLDAGHSVEGGHVTEMSQMIQALIQDGYCVDVVNDIYNAIKDVTKEGRRRYQDSDEAIIHALSDALIKSLQSGSGNLSTLADSFVKQVSDNWEKYHIKMKMPFSHPQIKSKFIAVVTSTLSKMSLRRTYPGLGTVQAPGYGFMQIYSINGRNYNYEEVCDNFRKYLREGETIDDLFEDKNANNDNEVSQEYILRFGGTPVLDNISIKDIDFEDTIVYLGSDGIWHRDRIDSISKYDYYRNLQHDFKECYRWNTQGRDLLQQVQRVSVKNDTYTSRNGTYTLYDFDSHRRAAYLVEIIDNLKKGKDVTKIDHFAEKQDFLLRTYNPEDITPTQENINNLTILYKQELKKFREELVSYSENIKQNQSYLTSQDAFDSFESKQITRSLWAMKPEDAYSEIVALLYDSDGNLTQNQDILIGVGRYLASNKNALAKQALETNHKDAYNEVISAVNISLNKPTTSFAQVITGRYFGSKFGLLKGDTIAKILNNPNFFRTRLKESFKPNVDDTFKQLFDVRLHLSNNKNIYVLVGDENTSKWNSNAISKTSLAFSNTGGDLYYNGDVLCNGSGIQYGTYTDGNGNKYDVLFVKDQETLNKVRKSIGTSFVSYNYNRNNWKTLLGIQYHYNIDENGNFVNDTFIANYTIPKGTNINNIKFSKDLLGKLINAEDRRFNKVIDKLSKEQYKAFVKSLRMIGARIPSQAMQSFSGVEVVNFTDSDENEIYLPRTLTWIAGSDYDIDKFYVMAFSISEDGTMPKQGEIEGFTDEEVNSLPAPDGRKINYDVTTTDENIPEELTNYVEITNADIEEWSNGSIEPLRKILESKTHFVLFRLNGSISEGGHNIENGSDVLSDANDLINAANEYNHISRNLVDKIKYHAEAIFKNKVVSKIQEALQDTAIQINLLTSLTMDDAKAVAKKNKDASRKETHMTADNMVAICEQQYSNMVGKMGIASVAVSQKAFNTVSFAINYRVTQVAKDIENLMKDNSLSEAERAARWTEIFKQVASITFDGKFGNNSIYSLANINFRPIINVLNKYNIDRVVIDDVNVSTKNLNEKINTFVDSDRGEKSLRIFELISTLQENCNKTNATDLYSNLMSAATDNAKELILSKLNAIGNFIDYYCYLFAVGKSFDEAGDFMTSPTFNLLIKFSRQNIFEIGSERIRPKHVMAFLKGTGNLPIINGTLFDKSLSSRTFLTYLWKNADIETKNLVRESLAKVYQSSIFDSNLAFEEYLANSQNNAVTYNISLDGSSIKTIFETDATSDVMRDLLREDSFVKNYLRFLENIIDSKVTTIGTYNLDGTEIEFSEDDFIDYDYGESDYDFEDSSNRAKFNKTSQKFDDATEEELRSFYRYTQEYILPRNKEFKKSNLSRENVANDLDTLQQLDRCSQEFSLLGRILSINQGMRASDYKEFSYIQGIEASINRIYIDKNKSDFEAFDFIKFFNDDEYQQRQIAQYDEVKETINVLDVIAKSPHFSEMLRTAVENRNLINLASVSAKLTRELANKLYSYVWMDGQKTCAETGKLNPGKQYRVSEREYKQICRFANDILILHFLQNEHLELTFGSNEKTRPIKAYSFNGKPDRELHNGDKLDLSSTIDQASFKHIVDTYLIPELKASETFGKNDFVRMLTLDSEKDKTSGKVKEYYKLAIETTLDEKSKGYKLYVQARKGLNEIGNKTLEEFGMPDWTLMDVLFVYNLLVSKEGFGNTGFSKIFEDLMKQNFESNIVTAFNSFIANIDSNNIKLNDLSVNSEDTSENTINYNPTDLLSYVITNDNGYKFNYAIINSNNLRVFKRNVSDNTNAGEYEISNRNPDISDFTINLPSLFENYSRPIAAKWDNYEPMTRGKVQYGINNVEVVTEIVRYLQELFGSQVNIQLVTNKDLQNLQSKGASMFADASIDSDNIFKATGFIHNGVIYINTDYFGQSGSAGTLMHELSHVIAATLKFNKDSNIRNAYYKILDDVWNSAPQSVKESFEKEHSWQVGSDLKEEYLVKQIAESFVQSVENYEESGRSIFEVPRHTTEIRGLIRNALNTMFRTNVFGSESVDITKIGKTSIDTIVRIVDSALFNLSHTPLTQFKVILNQQLSNVKAQMYQAGLDDDNDKTMLKYDCI